jgi:hypothetical protein
MADERREGEWVLQVSAKVGDHMINIRGFSSGFVLDKLDEIAEHADQIHEALSKLDGGRPATDIVQKEKQWGARSQGGRTYQKAPSSPANGSGGGGGWGVPTPAPLEVPENVPQEFRSCPDHHVPLKFVGPGNNKATGKPFSASMRCTTEGCRKSAWENNGSWQARG